MPYFYFDLAIGNELKDQGGMILEDIAVASTGPINSPMNFI